MQHDDDGDLLVAIVAIAVLLLVIYIGGQEARDRWYIRRAMSRATFERLEDDGIWYGEIPGFQGVWADAPTRDACRETLEEVLTEWVKLRRSQGLPLPGISQPDTVAA
jgi:predicted RNase H-like HicB family nuclease